MIENSELKTILIIGKVSITILTLCIAFLFVTLLNTMQTGNVSAVVAVTILLFFSVMMWFWNVFS